MQSFKKYIIRMSRINLVIQIDTNFQFSSISQFPHNICTMPYKRIIITLEIKSTISPRFALGAKGPEYWTEHPGI